MVIDCGPTNVAPLPTHADGFDACGLDRAEVGILRDIFALGDINNSGYISGSEVGNFIRMIGLPTTSNEVRAAARELDAVRSTWLSTFHILYYIAFVFVSMPQGSGIRNNCDKGCTGR